MKQLHPKLQMAFDHAKPLYPKILARLQAFEQFYDSQDDISQNDFDQAYETLQQDLEKIVNKNLQDYMLWEWWEADGIEALAFQVALPVPQKLDLTKDELASFIDYLTDFEAYFGTNGQKFENEFCYHFCDYVRQVLEISFPKSYDFGYFLRHKTKKPNQYFAFNEQQITDGIFSNQPFQQVKKQFLI